MVDAWTRVEGFPLPHGVTPVPDEGLVNFSLYSKHSTDASLLLFRTADPAAPARVIELDPLVNRSGRTWHVALPESELQGLELYGWRVEGPNMPALGHRFDPEKVLVDPYARGVFFPPDYKRSASSGPGDNAGRGPLGVISRRPSRSRRSGRHPAASYTRCRDLRDARPRFHARPLVRGTGRAPRNLRGRRRQDSPPH